MSDGHVDETLRETVRANTTEKEESKTSNIIYAPAPTALSDLVLLDQEGQEYHVHRSILAYRSKVWEATFSDPNPMMEPLQMGVPGNVLLTFLQAIYTGKGEINFVSKTPTDALDLWKLLDQYDIKHEHVNIIQNTVKNLKSKQELWPYLEYAFQTNHSKVIHACNDPSGVG